jgi:outer membrane protein assembly factor BamB/predicted Ser/Thr protein kinase
MRSLGESDPTSIASYRLLGVLGSGGMGKVYLAESRSGRRVAIKVVRSELAADPGWRRRFAREVAAVRAVSPLFTAAVVDADTEATEPWLATTYIAGPSLASRVNQSGPLAPGAVLVLAAGLAEALASIHKSGLVHRDLKPSNVIITDDGPQIIDFGIALNAETPATTSMLLGTPSYIAPERIHGSEADPASDIFSLGATLVFAATGKPLVTEGPVYAQLMQITTGRFDLAPVPGDLRPLIIRCVSHEPRDRPTAEELSRILGAARVPRPTPGWYNAHGPVASVPVVPGPTRLTRRRLLLGGGVLAGAAAIGATAVWLPPASPSARTFGLGTPTTSPAGTIEPPKAGEIVWMLASGAALVLPSRGNPSQGVHIVADAERVVTAGSSDLFALGPTGKPLWSIPLPSSLPTLRRWGDALLVNDSRRLYYYDLASGGRTLSWVADVVAQEEQTVGNDNAENQVIQVGEIALSPDRAFVGLGTATAAFDRAGTRVWRQPRPPRQGTEIRPVAGGPNAATGQWMLTHSVLADQVQVALRSADDGSLAWSQPYSAGHVRETEDTVPKPPPGANPPGGTRPAGANDAPMLDEDWSRAEGRLVGSYVVLREGRELHVLRVSNGSVAWERTMQSPVKTLEVVDDLVLVGADRFTAFNLVGGAQRWQNDLRGVQAAGTLDGRLIIAASAASGVVVALDHEGNKVWTTQIPNEFSAALVDHVDVDEHTVYVTFKIRADQAAQNPAFDVLAIALDAGALRPAVQ